MIRKKYSVAAILGLLLGNLVSAVVVVNAAGQEGERSPAQAKQNPGSSDLSPKNAAEKSAGATQEEKGQQETLKFVGEHQPKLLKLLNFLKEKQPDQYDQAVKEMERSRQRLAALASRDQDLYAIELELWQVRSQLRLIAAEMSVAAGEKKDALEQQLAGLVEQEVALDLTRLKWQRTRTLKQLEQFDSQIQQREKNLDEQISKTLKSWKNRISKQTFRTKNKKPR